MNNRERQRDRGRQPPSLTFQSNEVVGPEPFPPPFLRAEHGALLSCRRQWPLLLRLRSGAMGRRPFKCYRYQKNKPYPKSRFNRGVPGELRPLRTHTVARTNEH